MTRPTSYIKSVREAGMGSDASLHLQLFRYAEDLQMLLDQHADLEQRHRHLQDSHQHLAQSKDILENLIRSASDFHFVTDNTGVILHSSASADKRLLTTSTSLLGKSFSEFLGPPYLAQFDELTARLSAGASGQQVEHWDFIAHIDGDANQGLMLDAWILPVSRNGLVSLYWILRDITFTRDAEIEAQISAKAFRAAHEGIMITDSVGQILAVNPAFARITEYTPNEIIGKNPRILASGQHDKVFYRELWASLVETGNWSGKIINRKKYGEIYPEWVTIAAVKDEHGATLSYIAVFSDIAGLIEVEKELSNLAYHDTLTGLPNRRLLEDRAEQALATARRDGSNVSVLYLDLDRFKPINDNLGHEVGDQVLLQAGERMRAAVREADTVARVGGDEFVVLAAGSSPDSDLAGIAQKVIDALSLPFVVGEHEVVIGSSIGCARFPQHGNDIATLLKHADIAMYAAKRSGGNNSYQFEPTLDADLPNEKATLGTEIWHALERQELYLVYQPQVASNGRNTLFGCEALLRWRHPTLGEIPPDRFIPIAEKNGAIVSIGAWVLRSACEQLQAWKTLGLAGISMAVNVSPRQLRNDSLQETLASILNDTGINPAHLELEVTETEIMMYHEGDECRLRPLRELGVKIAIDDFGTGYSSLSRLQHLPVDRLKIDQSFVRDIETDNDARCITLCIVGMGVAMGLEVIAEGVETVEQMQRLNAQGCHLVQGYLIGRPMHPDLFLKWALENQATGGMHL